jgi:IclR helix-turn-helix domain
MHTTERADPRRLENLPCGQPPGPPASGGVALELSGRQVDQILRAAAGGASLTAVPLGLSEGSSQETAGVPELDDRGLSRSLIAGLLVLASFPSDGDERGIAELARSLRLNPSTTHRYVSTLVAVGLLRRNPATRRYRLAS